MNTIEHGRVLQAAEGKADAVPLQWLECLGSNIDHDAGYLCSENRDVMSQKYAAMTAKLIILIPLQEDRFRHCTHAQSVKSTRSRFLL
jgi:hypothetical protein